MKKFTKIILLALVFVLTLGTVSSFAYEPYETYTYSIDGKPLKSPTAYRADSVHNSLSMQLAKITPETPDFNTVNDVVTDENGDVYIADSGNNRIVILDKYFKAKAVISSYIDENGKERTLNNPTGLYVTDPGKMATGESYIYIADTANYQIVIFDRDYNYVRTIHKPDSPVLSAEAFKPHAIAVDIYGRIFVTSRACFEGVIVLSTDGQFTGFIGAQQVSLSFLDRIWRTFQSKEERASAKKLLANPYNNITVDDDGFVYVTTSSSDASDQSKQFSAITSKEALNSPVKKLNSAGTEIMRRNGFFDPGGEVVKNPMQVSKIVDVAIGPEGSWTILDNSRSRTYTYDQNGNLLFAFGDRNNEKILGNGYDFTSLTYQVVNGEYYMLLLDNAPGDYRLTVYSPTKYCNTIMDALRNHNEHNYSESIVYWQEVLTQNNNFDLAYIGIGKALYNQGKYEEAQHYLSLAYETDTYEKAFAAERKVIIQDWLLLIFIVAIVIIVLVLKFLGYAKKKNKVTTLKVGRKTYWEELLFSYHLVFHPFDGFWDLKHEKRGSVRASLTIMVITVAAFFYQAIGQGYSFNPRGDYSTVVMEVVAVIVPVALWCIGNWCLTTLFDGEGSFKDIFIATGYSLAPLPIFIIISTILSNVVTVSEGTMVSMLVTIGYVWVGLLLFFGMMVTHDYSIAKNLITVLGTIVAMAIIMFVSILFSSLVVKMVTFVSSIFTEIGNRA